MEDLGGVRGIGYISANATHIDVGFRTKKWWGDETTKGQHTIQYFGYNSWYNYFSNPYKEPTRNLKKAIKAMMFGGCSIN